MQAVLIESAPKTYLRPLCVGVRGWIGVDLDHISDDDLEMDVRDAWRLIALKRLQR
jgi:hypothetical protein